MYTMILPKSEATSNISLKCYPYLTISTFTCTRKGAKNATTTVLTVNY